MTDYPEDLPQNKPAVLWFVNGNSTFVHHADPRDGWIFVRWEPGDHPSYVNADRVAEVQRLPHDHDREDYKDHSKAVSEP